MGLQEKNKVSQDLIQGRGIPRDVGRTSFSMWKGKMVKRMHED